MSLSKPTVDHNAAEQLFRRVIAIAQDASSQLPEIEGDAAIRMIITGNHLTFFQNFRVVRLALGQG